MCVRIKGKLVGKVAFEYYSNGWRLTQSVKSPPEYDLKV